ncbi:MAG: SNF2 helicase associated domain-containing protein [Bacteroidetes bacterium]|nr:SNF2 helicase associated domain-containing protein [Bacteroidota bacterium]
MSLPPFLKLAYRLGTEEVIRRGKRIFLTQGVQFLDVDHLLHQVRFRVRNDQYQNYYTVTVSKYHDEHALSVRCQCPYNLGEICRHEVAALFQLNEMATAGFFEQAEIQFEQSHTLVRMRAVSYELLAVFTAPDSYAIAKEWAAERRVTHIVAQQERLSADVPDEGQLFHVALRQNDERYFDTSCSCAERSHPLCRHKAAVFIQLLQERGEAFFKSLQNWDAQKEKLLAQYGFSLKDNLEGKFEFSYQDGRPMLRVLDPSIKKIAVPVAVPEPALQMVEVSNQESLPEKQTQRLGVVVDTTEKLFPCLSFRLLAGEAEAEGHQFIGAVELPDLRQYIAANRYPQQDRELIGALRKLGVDELLRYLKKAMPFGELWDTPAEVLNDSISCELRHAVWEFLLPRYHRLLSQWSQHPLCFVHRAGAEINSQSLTPVAFSELLAQPVLRIAPKENHIEIVLAFDIGVQRIAFPDCKMLNEGIVLHDFTLHALPNAESLQLTEQLLPDGILKITQDDWPDFLEKEVLGWRKTLTVVFDDRLVEQSSSLKPRLRLYLSERERTLLFQPAFVYGPVEVRWGFQGDITAAHEGRVRIIRRDEETERIFLDSLRLLHSDMQRSKEAYQLAADAVLAHSWFFRFMDAMREQGVEVLGFEGLKQLRISTFKPETEVKVSSGIDWFDTEVSLRFGEQQVSLTEVKRAVANKQSFVPLQDGSIGLLPEEWLKKYSLLIKMGEAKDGKLRLRKFHFSVLDALLTEVDEDAVLQELEEKKQQLAAIIDRDFSNIPAPADLKATLRPYQLAGFQWLAFLAEAGWGGILADDMGLGKTVQALAYMLHYAEHNPDARFMVVCPTTLMYNWEAEIQKFAPTLHRCIHHGPKRAHRINLLPQFQLVITTYGTMRSDIRWLKDIPFDYVILDESQAIKNPQSQAAKASLLLRSRHKLALSGTPVQNNTFDLYAQMNFLNPGLLGSREFFANEFATPIDKFREEDITQQLRQLVYPFMLRRTKEQVAKDLPEKTETVLYCEMGAEQRKIYNAFRNTYKAQILGMIDEKGIERSSFHILQGLTRLRQICDSPAILNLEEPLPNHSIKSEELIREITENVGNHKALVFSQFLGMLAIIKKQLKEAGIAYAYFDGQSSAAERERAIQEFQTQENCRVFLISLKAGGVGLNLTAADYVYLVDPWWNPAVEQQAIDRTHRIGQTKNIFAYRLICKDTVEEKMLILQERKRTLAADLVADDQSMLKRLTAEDIAFLFS